MRITESALKEMIREAVKKSIKESYDFDDDDDSDMLKAFLKNKKNKLPKDNAAARRAATADIEKCNSDEMCKHKPNKESSIDKIVSESIKKVIKESEMMGTGEYDEIVPVYKKALHAMHELENFMQTRYNNTYNIEGICDQLYYDFGDKLRLNDKI